MVIIVAGLPGSGKSYFAERLSERFNALYLSSDKLRKKIFRDINYSQDEKLAVYEKLLSEALKSENIKRNVVLDGTFYKKIIREKFRSAFSKINQKVIFIEIRAESELIKDRLKGIRKDSDADYEVYKKLLAEFEPLKENHLTLFSEKDNVEYMLKEAQDYISKNS
jgi:predicted kinase